MSRGSAGRAPVFLASRDICTRIITLCLRRNTPRSLRTGTQDRIPRVSSCVHFEMSTALRSSLFHEATTYRASCCPRATTNVPRPIWIQPFPNAVHADGCSQPRTVFRGVPDASIPLFSFALAHQSLHLLCTPTVFSGATMCLTFGSLSWKNS